ncbi:conjugal transfer protein TrbH, partial [Neisseria gonorrhoeae]
AANTVFFLNRSKSDTFGTQLDQALREKGFATTAQQGENEKSLNYVLDQVDSDIYRVMIYIDGTPYSRAYRQTENGAVVPTGSWTKRGD